MSLIGTITTLEDLHEAFSDYLNEDDGSRPQPGTDTYNRRSRWFNRGREDLAGRWFWNCLLKGATVSITGGNSGPYNLPGDLTRSNALLVFATQSGNVVYTDPYDNSGSILSITRDFTTGLYGVSITPTPSTSDTADISYYATPTPLSVPTNLVLIDGEAVLWFALKQHFFSQGASAFEEMDEANIQYENRIAELLRSEAIHAPGSLGAMRNFERSKHMSNEKSFYSGNRRRF